MIVKARQSVARAESASLAGMRGEMLLDAVTPAVIYVYRVAKTHRMP